MSGAVPAELASAFVHVARPPRVASNPEFVYQRRFVGGGPTWYVDRDFSHLSHQGAHVYRNAELNEAELRIVVKSCIGECELAQMLGPVALVELAYRLLDAAHDIRAFPAPRPEHDPED